MSSTIEMLVNKQTIYRWPFNRLCYQAVIPDPTRRCCFPPAAVPRVLPRRPSLPSPAEFQLLKVYVLLPPPHRSNPVPEVLAFPVCCLEEQAVVPVILCVRFVFVPARIPRSCKVAPALSVSQQACFAFTDTWGVTD